MRWRELVAGLFASASMFPLTAGRNVVFEPRRAENHYDRLPALAADLVSRKT
jgi:hypothetical protein